MKVRSVVGRAVWRGSGIVGHCGGIAGHAPLCQTNASRHPLYTLRVPLPWSYIVAESAPFMLDAMVEKGSMARFGPEARAYLPKLAMDQRV